MSTTTYSSLNKPADGAQNAGEGYNDNMDYIDGLPRIIATLGENMTEYMFAYIESDGNAYIADSSVTDTSWTFGCIESTTASGNQEHFKRTGVVTNANWTFANIGQPVYLSTNGGVSQSAGTVERKLGIAWDTTEILLQDV